jgi:hypothetical protein
MCYVLHSCKRSASLVAKTKALLSTYRPNRAIHGIPDQRATPQKERKHFPLWPEQASKWKNQPAATTYSPWTGSDFCRCFYLSDACCGISANKSVKISSKHLDSQRSPNYRLIFASYKAFDGSLSNLKYALKLLRRVKLKFETESWNQLLNVLLRCSQSRLTEPLRLSSAFLQG